MTTLENITLTFKLQEELSLLDAPAQTVEVATSFIDVTSARSVEASVLASPRVWIEWILPNVFEGVFAAAEHLTWNGRVDEAFDLVLQFNSLPKRVRQWEGIDDVD